MKKVASLLLAVLMVCTMIPLSALPAFAEDTGGFTWPFGKGAGTAENPYTISSYNQLKRLADDVNGGADVTGIYFKLTQTIITNLYTPIGTKDHPFKGHFDGGGNIVAIRMNKSDIDYIGLFGCAEGAEIKNVYWLGTVSGHNYVGGICGYGKDTTITNCGYKQMWQIDGSVTATGDYVGSVCGYLENGSITDCTNIAKVSGFHYVGGICGFCDGGSIINCRNGSLINPERIIIGHFYVGGICGAMSSGKIDRCINDVSFTELRTATEYMGGICGKIEEPNEIAEIKNCVNNGDLEGTYIGGICGSTMESGEGKVYIRNCINNGNISGDIAGGLAGGIIETEIHNCISTGVVSGSINVGGFLGFNGNYHDEFRPVNVFWDLNKSDLDRGVGLQQLGISFEYPPEYDGGMFYRWTARTTEQMKSAEMLNTLNDYVNKNPELGLLNWKTGEDGYPCLDYPTVNDNDDPVNPFNPGEQLPPVILSGENSKWEKGSKDGVVVAASGAYDKLSAVYMDGEPVDESCLDVFPTAIAVDSDETSNGFAYSVIAYLGGDSAASRIVEPERAILFRVPWVDDEAAGGTHSDRGRQLAIILDDDSKEANLVLAGKTVLLVDSPKDAALSGGVRIRVRGGSTLDTSNDPLIVTDGSPSGSATIRIRGIGTINDNDPLYIIDGTPTTAWLHVLSYSGYDPTLKSRTTVTEDAGNGTSIILFLGVLADLPTDGESNALDVSAFTGIALKPEYLETLSVGSHTLKLVYADGAEVSTNIEIAAQTDTPTSPQTGDTSNMTLWIIMMLVSAMGLCVCLIFGKRKRTVK